MQTLWNSRDTLPAYPPLRENLHADAAVVGGGMAGILTAYALHTRGLRVVLLEGSRLASGVTAHTTAKITAQHGRFCERLVHDFGFHLAQQYLRANLCAVRQFRALVQQKRIDCGFSDESSFIYAAPDGPSLTRELEYALSLGAPARLVKPEGLPFPVREALCFERQAQLSPLPFLAALLPPVHVTVAITPISLFLPSSFTTISSLLLLSLSPSLSLSFSPRLDIAAALALTDIRVAQATAQDLSPSRDYLDVMQSWTLLCDNLVLRQKFCKDSQKFPISGLYSPKEFGYNDNSTNIKGG